MEQNSKKAVEVRFENRDGYLYAFLSGRRDNLSDAIAYWQSAVDECNKRGFKKLLVEQNFPIPLTTIDTFYLAEALSQMPISHLTVAFVDQDTEQNDMNMFAETVAVNRGGVGRVFTNFPDAEAWLLSSPTRD